MKQSRVSEWLLIQTIPVRIYRRTASVKSCNDSDQIGKVKTYPLIETASVTSCFRRRVWRYETRAILSKGSDKDQSQSDESI